MSEIIRPITLNDSDELSYARKPANLGWPRVSYKVREVSVARLKALSYFSHKLKEHVTHYSILCDVNKYWHLFSEPGSFLL